MIFSLRVIKYDLHFQLEINGIHRRDQTIMFNTKDYILDISPVKMHQHHVRPTP